MINTNKGIFRNWQIKILCFVIAVCVIFVARFGLQTKRVITMPLEVTLPESYSATSVIPTQAELVITGTEDVIYLLDASVFSLSADFSDVGKSGVSSATVTIDMSELASYVDLSKVSIHTEPSFVRIYFEER